MNKHDYPEIKVEGENTYYASLLSQNYAGDLSEDTAIHQYFYQSLIICDEKLSDALMKISMVEMHHLRIIGKLITLLGGDPEFGVALDGEFNYWSADNVDYNIDVEEMLKRNIMQEKNAILLYEKHIEEIDDKYIKEILKSIIEDELTHIKIFYSFYKKIK